MKLSSYCLQPLCSYNKFGRVCNFKFFVVYFDIRDYKNKSMIINKFLNGHDEFLHIKMQPFFFPAHQAQVISLESDLTFPYTNHKYIEAVVENTT